MSIKHIRSTQDSQLLKSIYQQVGEGLVMDKDNFYLKLLIKFVFYFLLSMGSYALLYIVDEPFYFMISFVMYGLSTVLLVFNFSHDFSHNTIFKSEKLNNFCFISLYSIVGAHAEAWKQRHIKSHHHAPNVEGYDSDLKITKLIRIIPKSQHFWFHKYQHIYAPFTYMIYSLFWIFIKDFVILYAKDEFNEQKDFKYHLSFWVQKSIYLIVILVFPLLFTGHYWYVVLFAFLQMHLVQSLFLLFTFFMTHHVENTNYPTINEKGFINISWVMNQIKSSNDMHPFSNTANFIFGGFNNHIAHHLFPHIHHVYYPRINIIIYDVLLKNNIIPNETTYWGGVVSHLKLLKRMSYVDE